MEKSIYNKISQFKEKEVVLERDIDWFNYKYANLYQIQSKINPIFKELKLVITHYIENQKVVTRITDLETGEYISSWIEIWEVTSKTEKTDKNWALTTEYNSLDPQWVWSIITYYRRYNLLALLDLETDDDDWASWSSRAKTKKENEAPKEKHKCKKCWEIVETTTFNGKFWVCFKCPKCNQFSWSNLVNSWDNISIENPPF